MYPTSDSRKRQVLFFVRYQQEFLRSSSCLALCFLVVLITGVQGMKAFGGCGNYPYQLAELFNE